MSNVRSAAERMQSKIEQAQFAKPFRDRKRTGVPMFLLQGPIVRRSTGPSRQPSARRFE